MKQKLGRYIIEEQLGEGSFAYVYRALDPELERHVALKVLKPAWLSDPAAVARFKQEARTMAKLDKSPHIAVVYEVGEDKGQVYLAQLLVDGETLAARLTRGPLAWSKVLDVLRPIASALDYAHSQGVIHRDIKPSNILLDKVGQAYLSDFGLVRAAEGSMSLSASVGGVKGTAAYIAPEVWDAEEPTPATDVYALSCVVFEMLTGTVLFDGSSMMAVMRQHDKGPRFPATWPDGVPVGVTEVLQRGLAADPRERIQSAGELLATLEALSPTTADEAEIPAPPPLPAAKTVPEKTPPAAPPQPRASKGLLAGGALALLGGGVVLVVIVGAILLFVFRPPPPPGPETPSSGDLVAGMPGDEPTDTPTPTEEADPTKETEPTAAPTDTPVSEAMPTVDTDATIKAAVEATRQAEPTDTPKPTSTPTPEPTDTPEPPPMVLVPAGPFEMGSDNDGAREDEKPVHTVTLDAYYIDKYEVTNVAYRQCVEAGGCPKPHFDDGQCLVWDDSNWSQGRLPDSFRGNTQPVVCVDWEQAKAYCEWRGARLPTEAEWEKAARGTDGRVYPWGNDFDGNRLNFCDKNCSLDWVDKNYDDGYADTAPVGSYPDGASPYGAYDMAGNVWEWVEDWYRGYPGTTYQSEDFGETFKVLRGGGWSDRSFVVRASSRNEGAPTVSGLIVGFRCVR